MVDERLSHGGPVALDVSERGAECLGDLLGIEVQVLGLWLRFWLRFWRRWFLWVGIAADYRPGKKCSLSACLE